MRSIRFQVLTVTLSLLATAAWADEAPGPNWRESLEAAKREAAATNRLVLIHFWAPWCGPCMRLESTVFAKPGVAQAMESRYVPVKVNAQDFPATCRQFGVERLPTDVIVTPKGKVLQRLQCPQDPLVYTSQLMQTANALAGNAPPPAANPQVAAAPTVPMMSVGDNPMRASGPPQNRPPVFTPAAASSGPPIVSAPPTMQPSFAAATGSAPGQVAGAPPVSFASATPGTVRPTTAIAPAPVSRSAFEPVADVAVDPAAAGASAGDTRPAIVNVPPQNTAASNGSLFPQNPIRSAPPKADSPPLAVAPAVTVATANIRPAIGPLDRAPPANSSAPSAPNTFAPRFGLDGYCPVTLMERSMVAKNNPWVWIRGDLRFGAVHRGVTYLFAGPEEQKRFLEAPDRYAPVLSGNDVVLAFDEGKLEPGRRQFGTICGGRVYLFSSAETLAKFMDKQNAERYIELAWRAENPQTAGK